MTPTPSPGFLKTHPKSVKVADPSDIEPGLDLVVQRMPHLDRSELAAVDTMPAMFPQQLTLKAVDPDGRLLGIGQWLRPSYFAEGWIAIRAVVRRGYEDHGVGSALRRAVLDSLPAGTTKVSTIVMDDEPRSLAIAERWGFTVEGHPIRSECPLTPQPPAPIPMPTDVTMHNGSQLDFPDQDAVDTMVRASDTSPEAIAGMRMSLQNLSNGVAAHHTPVGVLVRAHGAPAGISFGIIEDQTLKVGYTGVQPRYRGQGLGLLLKRAIHAAAAKEGANRSVTYNDASNTAIRRINADLGYVPQFGYLRVSIHAPAQPTGEPHPLSAPGHRRLSRPLREE